jgi:hypothetical protein
MQHRTLYFRALPVLSSWTRRRYRCRHVAVYVYFVRSIVPIGVLRHVPRLLCSGDISRFKPHQNSGHC